MTRSKNKSSCVSAVLNSRQGEHSCWGSTQWATIATWRSVAFLYLYTTTICLRDHIQQIKYSLLVLFQTTLEASRCRHALCMPNSRQGVLSPRGSTHWPTIATCHLVAFSYLPIYYNHLSVGPYSTNKLLSPHEGVVTYISESSLGIRVGKTIIIKCLPQVE